MKRANFGSLNRRSHRRRRAQKPRDFCYAKNMEDLRNFSSII
jgi:hypothetical protein